MKWSKEKTKIWFISIFIFLTLILPKILSASLKDTGVPWEQEIPLPESQDSNIYLNGEPTDCGILGNVAEDWQRIRYEKLPAVKGGLDAGKLSDENCLRLLSRQPNYRQKIVSAIIPYWDGQPGSTTKFLRYLRPDDSVSLYLEGGKVKNRLKIKIGYLTPLEKDGKIVVYWDEIKAGEILLTSGENQKLETNEVSLDISEGENGNLHRLRLTAEGTGLLIIDSIFVEKNDCKAIYPCQKWRAKDGKLYVVTQPAQNSYVKLWQIGYWNQSRVEFMERGYMASRGNQAEVENEREWIPGSRSHRLIFHVLRDKEGAQEDNFNLFGGGFFASKQAANSGIFRAGKVYFSSPCSGLGRLVIWQVAAGAQNEALWQSPLKLYKMEMTLNGESGNPEFFWADKANPSVIENLKVKEGENILEFDYLTCAEGSGVEIDKVDFYLKPDITPKKTANLPYRRPPLYQAVPVEKEGLVKVECATSLTVNGKDEVTDRLFGITSFNGIDLLTYKPDFLQEVKSMHPGLLRFNLYFRDPIGQKALSQAGKVDMDFFNTPEAKKIVEDQFRGYRFPDNVKAVRNLGASYVVTLSWWGSPFPKWFSVPKGYPYDYDLYADLQIGMIRLIKKFYPELKYVDLWNEPDGFVWEKNNPNLTAFGPEGMALPTLFNRVGEKIRKEFPEIKIVGPSSCAPLFHGGFYASNWWWTKMFIENAWKNFDVFSVHPYNESPKSLLGDQTLLSAFMKNTFGEIKPTFWTEQTFGEMFSSDWNLGDRYQNWFTAAVPTIRHILTLINNIDKVDGATWYDLCVPSHSFFITEWPMALPSVKAEAFTLFGDFRGKLLYHTESDQNIKSAAVYQPSGYMIMLFNDSATKRKITLNLADIDLDAIDKITLGLLQHDEIKDFIEYVSLDNGKEVKKNIRVVIDCQPYGLYAIRVATKQTPGIKRKIIKEEFYGDKVVVTLNKEKQEENINIPLPEKTLNDAKKVTFRLCYTGVLSPREIEFSLNGQPLNVTEPTLQDIEVEKKNLTMKNLLKITLKDATALKDPEQQFILKAASLILQKEIE